MTAKQLGDMLVADFWSAFNAVCAGDPSLERPVRSNRSGRRRARFNGGHLPDAETPLA